METYLLYKEKTAQCLVKGETVFDQVERSCSGGFLSIPKS
jgi:hypothetical protein